MTGLATVMAGTDNAKYVKRGAMLVLEFNPDWDRDVKKANRGKEGARFQYADGMIMAAAALRTALGVPYRQLSGMIKKTLKDHDTPHYATLLRRIAKLDVRIDGGVAVVRKDNMLMVADATGLKQHNRGEWIRKKWKVYRGFVKLHILIDADTGRILAVVVTDERTGDSRALGSLLGQAADILPPSPGIRGTAGTTNMLAGGISPIAGPRGEVRPTGTVSLAADGAYATRAILDKCDALGIEPIIRLKQRSRDWGTGDPWDMAVCRQFGGGPVEDVNALPDEEKAENRTYWKTTVGYGRRWTVEIVISALKRMFGEHLHSRNWDNMVQEVMLRVFLYNRWRTA